VSGGVAAAYVFQQNQPEPMTAGDGALVGLLAGVAGAFIYLLLSIPITILIAPFERALLERLSEMGSTMPPPLRDYMGTPIAAGVRLVIGFMMMLFVGSIFSTLGGVLGTAIFRKKPGQPGFIDVPPPAPPPSSL
jgi:hypothetical protein